MSTTCSGLIVDFAPPIDVSRASPLPKLTASDMPWILPLGVVSGVLRSEWASIQMTPRLR